MMLSERSQSTKSTYNLILFIYNSRKCKLISSAGKQMKVCLEIRKWGGVRRRVTKRHEEIWGDEDIIILVIVVVSWVYTDVKTHQLYPLNMCSL